MLLRRLSQHVKDQNWFAVGLDFLIVVIGILIAFQITNWNTYRAERAQEVTYLSALERDITYSISVLEGSLANLEEQQAARQALYAFHADPEAVLRPRELDRLIATALFALERSDINQITYQTLTSTGQISLIRSPDLVTALQDLSAKLVKAEVDREEDFQFTYRMSDPMLMSDGEFNNVLIHDMGDLHDKLPWIKEQPGAGYGPDVVRSRQFKNIVLMRTLLSQFRLDGLKDIRERHHTIQELIDARQAELGVES